MAQLYIIGTPIGNLGDVTIRALEALKRAEMVFAEDTRVTKKLLSHFEIHTRIFSYSEHSHKRMFPRILSFLKDGRDVALVSDAGTPGISDPGRRLIAEVIASGFGVTPIPGPSALSAIISVSDINLTAFAFFGFPPHKKGREKFFKSLVAYDFPVILFESPHRIIKTLTDIERFMGNRYLNIGRELTKMHEEIFRGAVSAAWRHFSRNRARGEFVIAIDKA